MGATRKGGILFFGGNMNEKSVDTFKEACKKYLSTIGIQSLRVYGRYIGVGNSTTLKKDDLIKETVKVLCGERKAKTSKRGAPTKNDTVSPQLLVTIASYKEKYLGEIEQKAIIEQLDFSKLKEFISVHTLDENGNLPIPVHFRNLMKIKPYDRIEERLYVDEQGDMLLVCKKRNNE